MNDSRIENENHACPIRFANGNSAETPVLDVADVVALEQRIAAAGTSLAELMDRAGTSLAQRVQEHAERAGESQTIVVLAGNGNNGGDGWVAARELAHMGHAVTLIAAKQPEEIETQPAHDTAIAAMKQFDELGVSVSVDPNEAELQGIVAPATIIVDAILGTGFAHDTVRAPFDSWITAANERRAQGALIIAADCPSGLNAQTGSTAATCIQADETVTMITSKTGLHRGQGPEACGVLTVAPLCNLEPYFHSQTMIPHI